MLLLQDKVDWVLLSESSGCLECKQIDSPCFEFISSFLIIGWVCHLKGEEQPGEEKLAREELG